MWDLAYFGLSKIKKTAQGYGSLDVCQGCIYNENQKCTFNAGEGLAMNAQLPMGCPKREDTQQLYSMLKEKLAQPEPDFDYQPKLTGECGNCKNFDPEWKTETGTGWCDHFDIARGATDEICEEAYDPIIAEVDPDSVDWEDMSREAQLTETWKREETPTYMEWKKGYKNYLLVVHVSKPSIRGMYDDVGYDEAIWYVFPQGDVDNPLAEGSSNDSIKDAQQQAERAAYGLINKEAQTFAPGPGPWERNNLGDGLTNTEVTISSPGRSGAGPFVRTCRGHAHTGTPPSNLVTAQDVPTGYSNPTNSTAVTPPSQAPNTAQAPNPTQDVCPQCGNSVPAGSPRCNACGYQIQDEASKQMESLQQQLPITSSVKLAQYPLCYFCGEAITGADQFNLVLNYDGSDQLGVSHLPCAQDAAKNQQGEFDDSYDLRVVEDAEKDPPSYEEEMTHEFEPNDEIVLVEDFEDLKSGDMGRIISDEEGQENYLAPRLDDQVYVLFDNSEEKVRVVPTDVLEKTSALKEAIQKVSYKIPCPYGHLKTVEIVSDHCVMATDDPDASFGCHDKRCQYHQPTSLQEWRTLVRNAPPESAPFHWLTPQEFPYPGNSAPGLKTPFKY